MSERASAVMVMGGHISADRNGLKFYTPQGEITKRHEVAIRASLDAPVPHVAGGEIAEVATAGPAYVARLYQRLRPGRPQRVADRGLYAFDSGA